MRSERCPGSVVDLYISISVSLSFHPLLYLYLYVSGHLVSLLSRILPYGTLC